MNYIAIPNIVRLFMSCHVQRSNILGWNHESKYDKTKVHITYPFFHVLWYLIKPFFFWQLHEPCRDFQLPQQTSLANKPRAVSVYSGINQKKTLQQDCNEIISQNLGHPGLKNSPPPPFLWRVACGKAYMAPSTGSDCTPGISLSSRVTKSAWRTAEST